MANYGIGGMGAVCLLRDGTAISAQSPDVNTAYMFWQALLKKTLIAIQNACNHVIGN